MLIVVPPIDFDYNNLDVSEVSTKSINEPLWLIIEFWFNFFFFSLWERNFVTFSLPSSYSCHTQSTKYRPHSTFLIDSQFSLSVTIVKTYDFYKSCMYFRQSFHLLQSAMIGRQFQPEYLYYTASKLTCIKLIALSLAFFKNRITTVIRYIHPNVMLLSQNETDTNKRPIFLSNTSDKK